MIGTDTEEEDELNDDSDGSHNSSSSSYSRKPDKKTHEEDEEDEEEKEFVDVFTDILSLIVLNKKQKKAKIAIGEEEVLAYESEFDKMKDSQMAPLRHQPIKKVYVVKETKYQQFEGSSICESELPQFA